jgi:hypothetical protein
MKVLQIKIIVTRKMRNKGHYQYMVVISNVFIKYKDVALIVADDLVLFNQLLARENLMLKFNRKSALTIVIKEIDERTKKDIIGLNAAITVAVNSRNPLVAAAGTTLEDRMKQYGIIYNLPLEEQTGMLAKLIADFTGPLAVDATTAGVNTWVTNIVDDNTQLTQKMAERAAEISAWPTETLRDDIRPEIDIVYKRIVATVNANIVTNGESLCGACAREINTEIDYFNEHDMPHRNRKPIANAIAVPIPVQTFTSEPVIPIPELHYAEPGEQTKKLFFPTDFTVTYKDNVNVGDAEITIHGKGSFKGQKIVTFNIARTV